MPITRRGALACLSAVPFVRAANRPIRLGGPIFLKSDDPAELAREHRRLGYSAAYCPKATVEDKDRVRAIEKAFAAENVVIAEVGAWVNLLDPDSAKRKANLQYVTERMALAEAVGARCCVDIAGSFHPSIWYAPHPKNTTREYFDATVENCRHVIDEVKPRRTRFSIEMQVGLQPEGPEEYLRLIRAVDRKEFAVHLDACNGINSIDRFYHNTEFIRACFQLLGSRIASCHAKDLQWQPEYSLHLKEVAPGRGSMDYGEYLSQLAKLPFDAPLMLEHLKTPEEYEEGKQHILKTGARLGLSFA